MSDKKVERHPKADEVLSQASMRLWLRYGPTLEKPGPRDKRTDAERAWDAAIFAAAEYVRRLTGDEGLALTVHDLLTPKIRSE